MRILDDTKSLTVLATDNSNGLGQPETIQNRVYQELNGMYECEFTVADTDKHFSDLKVGGIISTTVNDGSGEQMFRIYEIGKAINGISTVKCEHISYDLTKTVVKPFTATGASSAVAGMLTNTLSSTPFTMTTDITNTTSVFKLTIPRSFRECLGGYEGSLLDVFRGEYEWDNLTVNMKAHRGADNGVRIAYGKNLTDFNQEENNQNVYTSVLAYAVVDDVAYLSDIYHKVSVTYPKVKIIDVSSDYETGDTPTTSELNAKAQSYATNNPIEVPKVNIKVSFVALWQTPEYENILPLERVSLGDTVHVYFEKLGVTATARVIKTVWNVNLNRYDEIELGSARANLNTVINDTVDSALENAMSDIEIDTGYIEDELNNLADLITNGLGLFVTKDVLIDGSERIVLHNKPTVGASDVLYYIGANGLVVSTDGGSTWNAGFNPDGSAYFNALSANIIKALQIYGSYLVFGDTNTNYIEVSPYSNSSDVPQGVSFDGSGSIRFQPQGELIINNLTSNDKILNQLVINKDADSNGEIILKNNDHSQNYITANSIEMKENQYNAYSNYYYNQLRLSNYLTRGGSSLIGNRLTMKQDSSSNEIRLENFQSDGSTLQNQIMMSSGFLSLSNYNNGTEVAGLFLGSTGNVFITCYSFTFIKGGRRLELVFNNGYITYTDVGPA